MPNEFLTAQEAADFLRMSRQTLYKHTKAGELRVVRFGDRGHFRYRRTVLEEFIARHESEVAS